MRNPLPHQTLALDYCDSRDKLALFMQMRLGKSKVLIDHYKNLDGRILIIAPNTTLRTWKSELRLEDEYSISVLNGNRERRENTFDKNRKWNLINFEGLKVLPQISDTDWSAVAVDESSKLRNPKSNISKTITEDFESVPHKAILSGYPAPESELDYVQQFIFLEGHFMGFDNFWKARNVMFFPADDNGYRWIIKPRFRDRLYQYLHNKAFILTRAQAGLQNTRIHEYRYIPLEAEQKRLMLRAEEEFLLESKDGEKETVWKPVVWGWLAQLSGGFLEQKHRFKGKTDELRTLLTGELSGEPVVVWYRFNWELEKSLELLSKDNINCTFITGKISEKERWERRQLFQKGKVRVILCQEKVGLYALDFSNSNTNIYYSSGYSSEVREQTKQRIENPNKKAYLLDIDLVTEDSVDESVVRVLNQKKNRSMWYLKEEIIGDMKRRIANATISD